MKRFKPANKTHPELNITSLIDIIFILLVFFMVSSTFLQPVIQIRLPVAATREEQPRERLHVYVSEALEVFVEKEEVSVEVMQEKAAEAVAENPDLAVLLFCDKTLIFEHVVQIMDALKLAGVKHVAISHTAKR